MSDEAAEPLSPAVIPSCVPPPVADDDRWQRLKDAVLDGLSSAHSRRAYDRGIEDFRLWLTHTGQSGISKAALLRYRTDLQQRGFAAATINQRLCAVRRLVCEAADHLLLPAEVASSVARAKGLPRRGVRLGQWLSAGDVEALLAGPDVNTLRGKRDRALIEALFTTGLRRSEATALTVEMLQTRDGRHLIANLMGKGGRVRSMVLPDSTYSCIVGWLNAADIKSGHIFRSLSKSGRVGARLSEQAVLDILARYTASCGVSARPHDARRTFAALAYRNGARLEQVQLALGHSSVTVTEAYLATQMDIQQAPCDFLPYARLRPDLDEAGATSTSVSLEQETRL